MNEIQKFAVDKSALEKLSKFLAELPYKYKADIDAIVIGFNTAKPIQIAAHSDENKSDQTQ